MAEDTKSLTAGFTGAINEEKARLTEKAKDAVNVVKSEASNVVDAARENPTATSGLLVAAGAIGFILGYALSRSTAPRHRSFWS